MPNEFDAALSYFTPDPKALAEARKKRLKTADNYEQGYREGQQIREEQERAAKLQLQEQERLDKEQARVEAEQANLARKQRLADTERAYAREGRPTRTDAMGEIFTVDDDETWQRKQAEKKVAEDLKAQSRADAAFRKSEAVRLNQAETKLKAGLDDFDAAEAIGSQAVSAKASQIISLSQQIKHLSDNAVSEADLAKLETMQQELYAARKEKELLENSERTIKVAKLNKEQELKPALGEIQQKRDVLPITTAPAIPKGAGVTLQNTVSTATPTPASADPERAAAVLRTQITVLREKGDFARADALERRLTNPAKWEAEQKAFRQTATPEQLAQTVNAGRADITEQWQATEQVHSVLSAQRQAYYDRLDRAKVKNDALLNQPYSDGDVAIIRDETTGEETRWHKAAAEEYNGALQGLNSWQQANQEKIDLLNLNQQQLQIEAANLDKHVNQLNYLGREQQRQKDGEQAAVLNQWRATPGMAEFADETERRSAEFKQRQAEIERKYAPLAEPAADETTVRKDPAEFARKNESRALQKTAALRALQEEAKASDISMQERMAAKEQNIATLYTDWATGTDEKGRPTGLNITDWLTDDSVTPRLQQEAKARGLTEQEARKFLDYARKADWTRPLVGPASRGDMRGGEDHGPVDIWTGIDDGIQALIDGKRVDEPSRNLPNGTLSINPDLHLDKDAYMQAVQDAPSSPQAKKIAREQFTKLHELAGANAVAALENEAYIPGLPDFNNWRAEKLQSSPDYARKSLGNQALEFLAEMKARPTTAKYADIITRKVSGGLFQVGSMIYGAGALATGSEWMAGKAGEGLQLSDMLSGQVAAKGGADTVWMRSTGLLSELVPQLLPMMAGGGLLTLGGRISPMVAASIMGGVQTSGLQYASTYPTLRAQINPATGQPYTHLEAWKRAAPGAVASGIVTGLLTSLGGKTGGEAALAGMMSQAGREAARKALRESYKNVWATMKTITGHGIGEYLEEAPDELFSQISEEISTKGSSANLGKVIAGWIEMQPELMLAVTAMGSGAGTVGDLVNRKANQQALLAEDLAAAEAEIENYQDATLDQAENDHRRNRAALAKAIAQGVGLDGIEETILNSAGWTRKDKDGVTRADGSLTKIKDYTGPNVLDVDSSGKVKLDKTYVSKLGEVMPVTAGLVGSKQTAWHKPGQIEEPVSKSPVSGVAVSPSSSISPAPASPAPSSTPSSGEVGKSTPAGTSQTRGTSAQGAAPVTDLDTGGKTQAAASAVSGAAAVPAHAPDSKEAVAALLPTYGEGDPRPQRAWEIANHLEMAGLDRASANLVAASAIRSQGIKGKTVNDQVTSPEFNQLLDDLGATGDRTTREGSAPLALTRAPTPPKVSQPTASQEKTSPAAAPVSKSPAKPSPPKASPSLPEYAALRDRLKSKDISTVDAVREVIRLSGETDTGVLQDILTDHLGLKKPSAAAAVETLRAAGELKGDKNDDISIAAGKRASDRQPKPSDKAYTAAKEFVPATQGALAENPAWARAKLLMLARTPPARRRWAYRFLTQLENTISQRASLYDAIAIGKTALPLLNGQKMAVIPQKEKISLAIDLDRMLADFSYLGDPRAAAIATVMEEDIHAAQMHLMRREQKGGKWTASSLAKQWRDLPDAIKKAVWSAYNNVKASDNQSMPTNWDRDTAYHMQSEFLRMLVQGRIDPKSITEAVDASPGLIQSIKDLLADLYDTLRSLIKGLPVSQAVTLDQQVTELKAALEQLGKPSTAEELRTKMFLRDPAAVAMQALKNGTVFDQLATVDALFTPQGLARVWDLLTPEMRAQVERLKLTAAPWLSKKRSDNAALTRDLLTFLLDPRAAEALAQVNLTGSPAATASTGMVRRALRAMSDYFRNNRPDFAQTLGSLDLPTAQVLQQMQSLLVNARAQFEASALVQKLPTVTLPARTAVNVDEDEPEYRQYLIRNAADSAQAMIAAWTGEAQKQAFIDAAVKAANDALPGVGDAIQQLYIARAMAGKTWEAVKARMEANMRGSREGPPAPQPTAPPLLQSPAANSAQAIDEQRRAKAKALVDLRQQRRYAQQQNSSPAAREALDRKLAQEQLAAGVLAVAANRERQYYRKADELTEDEIRQIETMLLVASDQLRLPETRAEERTMGFAKQAAFERLGIRFTPAPTASDADLKASSFAYTGPKAPVYVEGGRIIIKQSTLDDLAQRLPITRNQIRMSESEARAVLGLPPIATPNTAAAVAEARAADQQQQDTSKVTARLEQLEAQERAAEKTSVKPVPLIDPNADPKTGKLHRGERGDLISWLGDHGSLGWPDSQAGGEWDWFLDLLGDYYNPESTGRTRKKALRDSKGNVIGIKDAAVVGTKLGMTNTAKKNARDGNLSTPAAIVEYLIQEGVVTPAIPTEDGSPRNLSLHENIGDRTGIDAIEEAARDENHEISDGIGNAVMTALDGREAARTNRQNDPERAAELQTLRFERDTRSGPVVVPAHELAPLSEEGTTFITARSQDGDLIPLEVASYEWQPIDPESAEADDYLEGHPAWRQSLPVSQSPRSGSQSNLERLVITLRGGTYYGQQTIPGDTLLRVEDAGNTGIGQELGDGKGDFVTDEEAEDLETGRLGDEDTPATENSEPGTENAVSTNPELEAEIYAELRKAGLLAAADRLRPAIRNAEGKIIVGRPGELHFEIARRDWLSTLPAWQKEDLRAAHERFVEEIEADKVTFEQGYHSDKTGFITGEEAIQYLPNNLQKKAAKLGELNSEMFGSEDGIQMRDTESPHLASSDRFYSQLARTVEVKMPNRADAKTLRGILENPQNRVKAEELKWSGLLAWADSQPQPLTKQQVLDYLKTEGSVRFEETRLEELGQHEKTERLQVQRRREELRLELNALNDQRDAGTLSSQDFTQQTGRNRAENDTLDERLASLFSRNEKSSTRNTQHTLPGGENHREVVVTWKQKQPASEPEDYPKRADLVIEKRDKEDDNTGELTGEIEYVARYNGIAVGWGATEQRAAQKGIERAREMFELRRSPTPPNTPNSDGDRTHYGDLDALAWFRANDREDGLLVEEFQSKWAALWKDAFDAFIKENYPNQKRADLTPEQKAKATEHANAKVPDAPWVSNTGAWATHLFKRALADAVAEGKQWIGWTTGDTQADRYDLSKDVDNIKWYGDSTGDTNVEIYFKKHSSLFLNVNPSGIITDANGTDASDMAGKPLSDAVGKEIARQIQAATAGKLEGAGLKVGGEGMRKFYDDILVKEFGKYIKPWGGKVTQSEVNSSTSLAAPTFQPISDSDWETFAGAEEFANGDRPLFTETTINVDGQPDTVVVIIDANGLQMVSSDGETNWMAPKDVFPGRTTWNAADLATLSVETAWKNEASKFWKELQPIVGEGTATPRQGTTPIWRIDITPQMRESVAAGQALFATDKNRDRADDEAHAAYAAGVRTYYDYIVRMKRLLVMADGFDAFKPYMRSAWSGIADRYGLPEPTRAAAEADYFRLARQKSPAPGGISSARPQGPTPRQTPAPPTKPTPSLPKPSANDLWQAGMDPEIIAQVVGTTPPEPTQADNTAAAAADLASLGEAAAPADAPSIFALPPEPDAPAMPDSPEERMEAGWNAHPEDEQLPSAPLFAKEGLDEAKPVNIQGGKSSLLARGIYNRAIAALARHAAAIGDMFFGTGTVTQYIHKAGLGKPGGHASEYSPWRASFLRQVTDPTKVEALARGARAGIDELKRVQEASRAAVTGSADFYQAVKGFVDFINSLEHSGLSTDTWNAIRKRAVSGYQTSLKDKNYTDDEFALKVEHFARVHGLKARVMIGMYQALPTGFDLNAYMQKVAAAQAWDKHLIEARDGQTSMFAPTQAEHPGPIPVRDDPTTTGLYIAAEMLGDNGISLDLATEQKEITVTDKNGKAQKKTVKVLTDKLAEPFTGLFDTLDWHDSARANNIEKLIRDYHQVFVGKTIHSANSWLLLPRLAREHPGIGFVIDPPYFGVPETKNGKTLIDSATGQPVRKGTSNYDSTTDIRTPDDLLRLFDSYVLPAWQSGAKFVLTNEWDDSAAVALRLRGATVVKIVRQGRKGDTPELVAYNFNPTDGTLRPHRISEVTPSRAFNALQRGAYPGTSHSGNLDPRLKLAARAAAEAQPEAARVALQQRQDASQLSRGNASGRGDRPVGADQRPAPRAPTVERTMSPLPEGADMTSLERAEADALQREQQDLEEQFDTLDDELGTAADEAFGEDEDQRLSSSDRQPSDLSKLLEAHPDAGELSDIDLTAYRVGTLNPFNKERGSFFGDDYQSAEDYASRHPGHDVTAYRVEAKKAFVAKNLHQAWRAVFGKPLDINDIDRRFKFKNTALAWRWADTQLFRKLRGKGYDALILRDPAPPARHEIALIDKSAKATPLASAPRITEPPFSTPESKALEDTRIHAIDTYLHGTRRPIANTPPADQAGSSRTQLQTLLSHLRRGQRTGGSSAGNEQTGRAKDRQRDKALLIDWARNAGVLMNAIPGRYQIDGPKDKGGREHHVFHDSSGRWLKITKGDGDAFGLQPLDEGGKNEWMLSPEPADAASYLEKLILHNQVFHDDIVLHGVVADPLGNVSLIISQPDYKGTYAGVYTAIKPAMEAAGFVRVEPPSARLEDPSAYYRPSDNLAVVDLHDQNAVLEGNGTFLRVFDNIMLRPTGALRATFERLAAKNAKPVLASSQRLPDIQTAVKIDGKPHTSGDDTHYFTTLDYLMRQLPAWQREDRSQALEKADTILTNDWLKQHNVEEGFLVDGKFLTRQETLTHVRKLGLTTPLADNEDRDWFDTTDLYELRALPVSQSPRSVSESILAAAAKTNTSPSKAQIDAENYETGKVTVHGLRLSIENPAGSVRKGTDSNGKAWEVTMPHHYGRILGTTGADKDHVDFFLGPDPASPMAFVVNQKKPGNGHFDEHKVMLGFTNPGTAARGYLDSYSPGWRGYDSIVPMTIPQLKHWLEHGKMGEAVTKAPVVSNDTAKPKATRPATTHTLPDGYQLTGPGLHLLPASIRAYHGTPHEIDPREGFRTSKIGTGEGSQVYGWGLYFARAKAVAADYAKKLGATAWKLVAEYPSVTAEAAYKAKGTLGYKGSKLLAKREIESELRDGIITPEVAAEALYLIDTAEGGGGNLYTVELLPDEDEFLDWDKPLSEQSEKVKAALMQTYIRRTMPLDENGVPKAFAPNPAGEKLYAFVGGIHGEEFGSKFLRDAGIPGIRYLDQSSRNLYYDLTTAQREVRSWEHEVKVMNSPAAKAELEKAQAKLAKAQSNYAAATHNYVLFDDKLVKIIERNGTPIDTPALASSNKHPLPAAPDMDDYQTWGKDKATRDREWNRYRTDMAKWEAKVAAFASKQGNLGTFLAPLKSYPSGQAYREARTITRVPGDATRWRATIFGQQPITATSIPVGDWANNAWVPVAHNEFETKAEAYQSSANAMPEGYTFSTQPLFAANRTTLAAAPRFVEQASRASFNHLDRWFTGAIARQAKRVTSSDPVTAATQAATAWWNQDTPGVSTLRSLKELAQRELLPETVLPREIMSAMREMQIKQSMGQQKALDVGRALSDKPKFSDLHYPPEFVENPMHREQMFSAMEQGKVDTLPPALQEVAKKLRQMLVEAGREAVKQGRMNPDTFEGLRTNFMPRFTKEEAQASAGDFAKRFKLGVKDILAQRSTAFHITDTSRKDKNGLPQIVSHARGKWRFDSQQARDAYYEDLINRQTLDGDLAKNDMHWMNRGDARALRSITPEMLKTPATMTKDQRDVVARVQRQLRNQFKKEDPYEPKDLVKDPVYAVMRYLAQMTHDNAVAEFFNVIDTNPDWTSTTEMKGFTQIPDNDRFGALAGKFVRKDIADQVMELAHTPAQVIQLYDTLLRLWKTGKTVLNPATHARNIIGNLPFAQFAGNNALNPANWTHYTHAMRTLREGGDEYRQLYETGVLGADYASTELRAALENIVPVVQEDDSTNPIRHLIALGNRAAQWGKAHSLANVATLGSVGATAGFIAAGPLGALAGAGIAAAANPIYRAALWAYRLEDDLFKAAAFFKARAMGMTLDQAAQHVRDWFPYYDKPTSTTLKFAGRTTMPFLSFFREAARISAKAAKERPLSLAATLSIPAIITALSQAALGLDDEDKEDVKAGMRGKGAKLLGMTPLAGVPIFSMLIPWRTSSGQLQQIDLSSTHPMADFLANRVENWNNDPWWQAWSRSALANPMLGALYTAATGRDPFGDRTLWDSSYSSDEKAKAILGHAWKTAMPPLTPGGTNWTMIEQSTRRQANKTLALRSPAQAVGRGMLGIDVRTADPDIYSLADAFRKRRGLPVTEGNTAYPTDAAGRARKALFEELVQPQPDPKALAKLLQSLNDLGKPVRTVADVLDILDYRRPDGVINPKELRAPFRASLAPEARRVLDTALKEFQRARAATPGAFAKARQQIKPTTRAPITEP